MKVGLPRRSLYAIGFLAACLILFIRVTEIGSSPIDRLVREAQFDPNDGWSDFFTPAIKFWDTIVQQNPSVPRAKPSIFICQHIPYFNPLYRASYATHLLYAESWGYGYRADKENYMLGDERKNAVFMNKIYALKRVLIEQLEQPEEDGHDWIFMTDADSLISDPAVPLHLLLPPDSVTPTPLVLGTQDHNGFNAGAMLYRIDNRVLFAQYLVENPDFAKHFYEIPRLWINAYWFADTEEDPNTPQLQVHLVNHFKRRVPLGPIVRHNLAILQAANEARSLVDPGEDVYGRGSDHGLDLLPQWEVTAEAGRKLWEGVQGGVEGMRWLWD
ncbi:hypothetical protein IAT40_007708 [Kwoniella sp. CBS 6097]